VQSSRAKLPALTAALLAVVACSGSSAPGPTETNPTPPAATSEASSPTVGPTLAPPTQSVAKITPFPGAPDSGVSIKLIASHAMWNVSALTAPAGKVWHLIIDNRDTNFPHNFVVSHVPELQAKIFAVDHDPNRATPVRGSR
jgi:hypothetical protein